MKNLQERSYVYYEEINPTLFKYIPSDSLVLDVGCGFGALGEAIRNKNNYVIGLEIDKKAQEVSSSRLNEVYQIDIAEFSKLPIGVKNKEFDVIVFSDVLEHLLDPFSVLINYQSLLKKGGKILISIPNAVVWDARLSFLFGVFEYSDAGTWDRTHLRFFTFKSIKQLINESNLRIINEDFTPGLFRPLIPLVKAIVENKSKEDKIQNPRAILESTTYKSYLKLIFPLEKIFCSICKGLFAFQFVFVTEKK